MPEMGSSVIARTDLGNAILQCWDGMMQKGESCNCAHFIMKIGK